MIHIIETLTKPVTRDEFIYEFLGEKYLFVPNPGGRAFDELMSWETLNDVMDRHQMDAAQFSVFSEGKLLPPESYMRRASRHRLCMSQLNLLLRDGATFVLNGVDELHAPLARFCDLLEYEIKAPVRTNLYAGWHNLPGFTLHWDDHDVFILQIAGKKLWEIHGVSEIHPLGKFHGEQPPGNGAIWREHLQPGDVLYLPRGWWHVAYPCDEPTLHLTVGFTPPIARDYLMWLVSRLERTPLFRRSIPRLLSVDHRSEYCHAVQAGIAQCLSDPEVLREFFRDDDASVRSRPRFGFPWVGMGQPISEADEGAIVIRSARGLQYSISSDERVIVRVDGNTICYHPGVEPLLEALSARECKTVSQMFTKFAGLCHRDVIRSFLADLVSKDVISILPDSSLTHLK